MEIIRTTEKNLKKAIDIENNHDVNVIAYSWPSQPFTGKDDPILSALKKESVKKLISSFGGNHIVNLVLSKTTQKAEEFFRNYLQARTNAEASPPDFNQALKVIDNFLLKPLGSKIKISLLSHSLGNYLLQNTIATKMFKIKFKNIILHQADVDGISHATWAKKLYSKSNRLYITINQYDYILMAANFVNREERLGQTNKFYGCKKASYIEFTDATDTSDENEHEFFRLKLTSKGLLPKYTNEAIFSFFDKTLNSKSAPKKGFKKKGSNHFRLAEIIDPVDGEIRSS